jgi:hypothetical protein
MIPLRAINSGLCLANKHDSYLSLLRMYGEQSGIRTRSGAFALRIKSPPHSANFATCPYVRDRRAAFTLHSPRGV